MFNENTSEFSTEMPRWAGGDSPSMSYNQGYNFGDSWNANQLGGGMQFMSSIPNISPSIQQADSYNWGGLGNLGSGHRFLNAPDVPNIPTESLSGGGFTAPNFKAPGGLGFSGSWNSAPRDYSNPSMSFGGVTAGDQPSFLEKLFSGIKNTSQQQIGNMNLGDAAYKLGALFLNNQANRDRKSGINQGISTLQQAQNPHLRAYQDRLLQMIMNPGDYGRTPYGEQLIKDATQAVRRGLAKQGRAGTVNETALAHQAAAGLLDKSYGDQVKTLTGLSKADTSSMTGLANLYSQLGNIDAAEKADMYNILGQIGMGTGVLRKPSAGDDNYLQKLALMQLFGGR